MEAIDQLRDQVTQAAANVETLTSTVAAETAQIMQKFADLEGQIVDAATVQELTGRMTAINQAMSAANAAIQGIVPDAPPPQP